MKEGIKFPMKNKLTNREQTKTKTSNDNNDNQEENELSTRKVKIIFSNDLASISSSSSSLLNRLLFINNVCYIYLNVVSCRCT